jgi:N-acetylglucosamine-6-phosphate deacetylase
LRLLLDEVVRERSIRQAGAARVLAAHLESNFINPAYCGAQPNACLRGPREGLDRLRRWPAGSVPDRASVARSRPGESDPHAFDGDDILRELERRSSAVGVVTLAPELDGALDLVRGWSREATASLGHSGLLTRLWRRLRRERVVPLICSTDAAPQPSRPWSGGSGS